MALAPPSSVKSAGAMRRSSGARPAGGDRRAVAVQAALGPVDLQAAGDRGHLAAAPGDQVLDGGPRAPEVVGVDRGQRLGRMPGAADHTGHAQLFQELRERVVGVHGDQEDPVDAVGGEVLGEPHGARGRCRRG